MPRLDANEKFALLISIPVMICLNATVLIGKGSFLPIMAYGGLPLALLGITLASRKTTDTDLQKLRWNVSVKSGLIGFLAYCAATYAAGRIEESGLLGAALIILGVFMLPINFGIGFLLARLLITDSK